jgi:hypothetical protein
MKKVFYYPYNPFDFKKNIKEYPELLALYYDLEPAIPPHVSWKSCLLNMCPAMKVVDYNTYLIRSPFDFNIKYKNGKLDISENGELEKSLFILNNDDLPFLQLSIFYLFWTNIRCDITLWQHDPPFWAVNGPLTWYSTSGMIPIGKYTRNVSVGICLKEGHDNIKIKRGDVISAVTFAGTSSFKLEKMEPSERILRQNERNNRMKNICPYKASINLFKKWLTFR